MDRELTAKSGSWIAVEVHDWIDGEVRQILDLDSGFTSKGGSWIADEDGILVLRSKVKYRFSIFDVKSFWVKNLAKSRENL